MQLGKMCLYLAGENIIMIVGGANQSNWNFSEEDRKVLLLLRQSTCMPLRAALGVPALLNCHCWALYLHLSHTAAYSVLLRMKGPHAQCWNRGDFVCSCLTVQE